MLPGKDSGWPIPRFTSLPATRPQVASARRHRVRRAWGGSPVSAPPLRMSELAATFALAQDNAFGQPLESQLRSCLLAAWLSDEAGLGADLRDTAYWVSLLRYVGCTGHAHEDTSLTECVRFVPNTAAPTDASCQSRGRRGERHVRDVHCEAVTPGPVPNLPSRMFLSQPSDTDATVRLTASPCPHGRPCGTLRMTCTVRLNYLDLPVDIEPGDPPTRQVFGHGGARENGFTVAKGLLRLERPVVQ